MEIVIEIILICILINSLNLTSIIFFGVGIAILGAINFISQNKIPINKFVLIALQTSSVLFTSLSLLNEAPIYSIFCLDFGMSMFYILYNLKNENKISKIILLLVACFFIDIAFFNVLNILGFLLFTVCLIGYLCFIYLKKPHKTNPLISPK